MEPCDKPTPNPAIVLREEFDDWAVLFNPDTGDAVGMNPVGVAAWTLMDGRRSLDEIVAEVDQLFDGMPRNAVDDMTDFVDNLAERGFVGLEFAASKE